jgi:hypothetical protein
MRKTMVVVAAAALAATQAFAGMYYEAKTTAGGRKGADMMNSTVKGWVSGDKAKIEFTESNNPMAKEGMYMITVDGGKTVYMVNPKEKSYFKWDIDALGGMAGGMMKMMNFKVTDPQVEKVGEDDGGTVLGLPTTHYTYKIGYTTSMKFMMIHKTSKVEKVQEIWSAPKLIDEALGIYLRKEPPTMGNEDLAKLVKAQMSTMKGFPLKMKTVETSTDNKGKSETTTIEMEVTKLELQFSVPDSTFAIPPDYTEAEMPMSGPPQGK